MEIKTRRQLLNDFMKEDFVGKADLVDLLDTQKWVTLESVEKLLMDWEIKVLDYDTHTPRDMYFQWCREELIKETKK